MDYSNFRAALCDTMQHLELNNMMPHVSDDVQFDSRLGTYAFLQAIAMDLRRHGNTQATQVLAVDAFWKRLPANIRMNIMQTSQSLTGLYGIKDSEFNIVALAAKTYDSNMKRCEMYDSGVTNVPAPVRNQQSPNNNTSYSTFGYTNQGVANPGNSKAQFSSEQSNNGDNKVKMKV